ncbi:helix-turn-helix domain-containing protein [Allosphingosinicella deserti]|uniref:helix-turn-helix domain-containing protein n=1 Tax=Allosphingosinicella deserti TaxID=2116704 RepID=UPI001304F41C|nr:helix-turn-helix domain-containing protein [Sphingomonas deserti]
MAAVTLQPVRFDTSVLPEDEQFSTYASGIPNWDMSRPGSGAFAARAMIWRLESIVVAQLHADPACYTRSAERIRADRTDHFYVNYHYRGRARVDCGQNGSVSGPRSLLVLDTRQPCHMEVDTIDEISLAVPRHLLIDRLEGFDPHGLIASDGLASLLGSTLRATCATLSKLGPSHVAAVQRVLLDLVVETLLEALRAAAARTAREEELASRVRAYIDRHLGDELDVATLCRALGISRSNLYRSFGEPGGVLRHIQARRLRRMQAYLSEPSETRSISALAHATGFRDKSHFTRAFRKTFGVAPSEFRRTATAPDAPDAPRSPPASSDGSAPERYRTWLRDIS